MHFERCGLTDIAATQRAIDAVHGALGPIDSLVNDAGNDERQPTEEVTEAMWDECLAANRKWQFSVLGQCCPT